MQLCFRSIRRQPRAFPVSESSPASCLFHGLVGNGGTAISELAANRPALGDFLLDVKCDNGHVRNGTAAGLGSSRSMVGIPSSSLVGPIPGVPYVEKKLCSLSRSSQFEWIVYRYQSNGCDRSPPKPLRCNKSPWKLIRSDRPPWHQ